MIGAVKSYKMIVKGDDDIAKIQEKHETANKMEDLFSKFRVALPEIKQNKKKSSFRRHILPFSAVI
ncbi:MAG: hypothetical protein IJ928_04050 [Prevotella sp.]|nr:hypothetical protein [Prevotella sp.]